MLAATILIGCGEDPALRGAAVQSVERSADPSPRAHRTTSGPAVGQIMVARYLQRVRWAQVSRWSTAAIYAALYDRAQREASAAARKPSPSPVTQPEGGEAPHGIWSALAQCESGGDWGISTGNGFYGGLQFTLQSWHAVGGSGYPHQASASEQIARGQALQRIQGWGAWPGCASKLGLR